MRTNQIAKDLAKNKKQEKRRNNGKILKTSSEKSLVAKYLIQDQINAFAEIIVDLLIAQHYEK